MKRAVWLVAMFAASLAAAQTKLDTAALAGAIAGDAITTQRGLSIGMREMDPLARALVSRGIAGQTALSSAQFALVEGAAWILRKAGHDRAAKWLARTAAAGETATATSNAIREHLR
jgi:hypothetical protein